MHVPNETVCIVNSSVFLIVPCARSTNLKAMCCLSIMSHATDYPIMRVWTLVAPSQDVKEKRRFSMIVSFETARPGKCLQHL